MRYFHRLVDNLPVFPIMHVIMRHPQWWDMDTARTSFKGSPHAQAHDILLRCCATEGRSLAEAYVDLESIDRELMLQIPTVKPILLDLVRSVNGTRLGRVVITKTEPGQRIAKHVDEGPYAEYYSRYHIVLQGLPGSMFMCGDETVNMLSGEIWWFDHRSPHELINNSKDDRVHLIADIRIDQ